MKQAIFLNARGEIRNAANGSLVGMAEGSKVDSGVQEYFNSLGAEQSITTLTAILADTIKTKYFEVEPSKYVPIVTGEGNPYVHQLTQWKTNISGSDFEGGYVNLSSNSSQKQSGNIEVEPLYRPVFSWAKEMSYNIMQQGVFSMGTLNLDYVQLLYEGRKKEYDLGIQKLVFLGSATAEGLLNQTGLTSNTTLITEPLAGMTAAEFNAAVAGLIPAFRLNCNYSAYPTAFYLPEKDFLGLANQMSETYPLRTKLSVLKEVLELATMNPNFEVLPIAYAMQENNTLNKNRYVLLNKVKDSIRMDVPLPFTVTLPNSMDNFNYTSAAYSRFSGVKALRDKETMYFDYANAT